GRSFHSNQQKVTGLAEDLRAHLSQTWPFVELHCYAGGQPRYLLLVGVE
ncbi:MAG: fatty acid kinase, partial [Actinoplanes sp.]|nr:fatty acid kinase [Actinoplanes sp.]